MQEYRVFISYAHKDKGFVEKIADILKSNGLVPVYDKDIPAGTQFDEHIKKCIAHAHVFLPVITKESSERGWVHQEIGYALALNIPMLPISREPESLPEGMIQKLNAYIVDENLTGAADILTFDKLENLIKKSEAVMSTYVCRVQAEQRAELMSQYAEDVIEMKSYAKLRQKGGLSSFQIPNEVISDPIWDERYDTVLKNDHHCECQLKERQSLEKHVLNKGCKLIINPALITSGIYSNIAIKARVGTFLEFLESMPDDKVEIAIDPHLTFNESVTILGDWFSAESYYRPETQGFKQTMFTRHAPGINKKIEVFDKEFDSLMRRSKSTPGETRKNTIEILKDILKQIE